MGIYEDIKRMIDETLSKGAFTKEHKMATERVAEWLDSAYCPLVPEMELGAQR